jgi:hypothetical protein
MFLRACDRRLASASHRSMCNRRLTKFESINELMNDYKCPGITFWFLAAMSAIIVFGRLPNIPGPLSDPAQYPGLQGFLIVEDIAAFILFLAAALILKALWTLCSKLRSRPDPTALRAPYRHTHLIVFNATHDATKLTSFSAPEVRHVRYVRPYIPKKGDWELPPNWRS